MVEVLSGHRELVPPSKVFGELFVRVAQLGLFPAKDWADAKPRDTPRSILAAYQATSPETPQDVLNFVRTWFELPGQVEVTCRRTTLEAQIDATWAALIRRASTDHPGDSLIPLPNVSVSPGGRFRECYYWDSYFTLIGLKDRPEIIRATAENMCWQIRQYGFVPNGNRTYYLTRSQPPLFFKIVELLASIDGDHVAQDFLPDLIREHAFWMTNAGQTPLQVASRRLVKLEDGTELNRYWDDADIPRDESFQIDVEVASHAQAADLGGVYRDIRAACESGWDFSSRWFDRAAGLGSISTTSILPVDLNSFLYGLEMFITKVLDRSGQVADAQAYRLLAERRLSAISHGLWNHTSKTFDDFNWKTGAFCGSVSVAMVAPLWMEAATPEQARQVALQVERNLLAPGGLMSTTVYSGEQWDAPNGWAPLQWMAAEGLSRYGHDDLASEIRKRWVSTVETVFASTGRLFEKYDVVSCAPGGGGEYAIQDGFGWTNGVTKAFMNQLQVQVTEAGAA